MNVSIVKPLALAGSLACMAAFQVFPAAAQEIYPQVDEPSQHSTKTRAEVRSEYLQSLKEGSIPSNSEFDEGPFGHVMSAKAPAPSSLTREQVQADAMEWMRLNSGDLDMGSR
ncbi:DUF4148 domain-containing protein [Hydrogenophaga sp. PAMC20947]|uniref:DUF4148 domain-containing protein n=1 Tax=Hydrogenophaga sp. PAMC20947 TaxID=2565558 RepID=UPI00109DA20D|nr:DUF4148 domain-containing protein [Hydrogenophaga sp. PAMC20947]QCB48371.1 DUF4148 domain-containing protein [Hydrogenophaga sp. PAMC20947]